jgi:xanthosine utilization system XapX-like protein
MPKDAKDEGESNFRSRVANVRQAFTLTRAHDPKLPWVMAAPAAAVIALLVLLGVFVFGHVAYLTVIGVLLALLAATAIFNRRATAAVHAQLEERTAAAAALLQSMRGDWRVTPAAAATASGDFVHRVLGRPGVVLVGEGSPARVGRLLAQEKKRVGRVVFDTPVYDVTVGDEGGQVSLRRLQRHLMKMPRNLRSKEVDGLESRMRALSTASSAMPKGPMPKNAKVPKRFR